VSTPLLDRLQAQGVIDADARQGFAPPAHAPWWLAVLLAGAAWIASLIILSTFFIPLVMLGDSTVLRVVGACVLLAGALHLFRRQGPFPAQMALAFSLAGQGVLAFTVADALGGRFASDAATVTGALVAAALLWPHTSPTHRMLCALIVAGNAGWLIGPGAALALYGVVLAAGAAALWLTRVRWSAHRLSPQIKAAAHAATLAALVLAPYGHARLVFELTGGGPDMAVPLVYSVGAGAVLVATAAWLVRDAAPALRFGAPVAAMLLALAAWPAPGLVVAATLLLAAFHACHRPWTLLALAFAALYLGELYYSLHATLLVKSIALAASGALLLVLRAVLRRWAGVAT